jgi:hypothetical protein
VAQRNEWEPLNDYEKKLAQRILAKDNWPQGFLAEIVGALEINQPKFLASDLTGLHGEEWVEVGSGVGLAPAFEGTWASFDAVQKPRFYKDALGIVHLGGAVKSGTINTTAFTLPEGYRPGYSDTVGSSNGVTFPAYSAGGAFAAVRIFSGGEVRPTHGTTTYIALDVITFRAA